MTDADQQVLTRSVEGISRTEHPLRFRAGDDEIFGILTEPLSTPRGIGVVLLNAASDRNRFLPRLARRLAGAGFHVMRIDYRGFGESSGPSTGTELKHALITLNLEEPFTKDLLGAVEQLRQRGVEDVVVIGRCFGSRTALAGVTHLPRLRAMGLITLPLHGGGDAQHPSTRWALDEVRSAVHRGVGMRAVRSLWSPRRRTRIFRKLRHAAMQLLHLPGSRRGDERSTSEWLAESVVESLRELVARKVPVLVLYSRTEPVYRDWVKAQAGPLRDILASAGDRLTVTVIDGPAQNLTSIPVQDAVMTQTQEWLESAVRHVTTA